MAAKDRLSNVRTLNLVPERRASQNCCMLLEGKAARDAAEWRVGQTSSQHFSLWRDQPAW